MNPSLRYKIGQMLIIGFEGTHFSEDSAIAHAIQEDAIGGVILFDYHYQTKQFEKNIKNPLQVRRLNHDLQQFNTQSRTQNQEPLLPLIISVDYEGGQVNRLKEAYGFPATISPAEAGNMTPHAVAHAAEVMAETLQSLGFNLDFTPVVDVNITPQNPIIGQLGRSFSADPQKVAAYAKIYVETFAKFQIQCVYKHFPGHGSSLTDSHLGFVDVTDTWQDIELVPYQILLKNPTLCSMIMTAHIVNRHLDPSGLPATLSRPILSDLLRKKLQFQGIIITDDMQMKAIADHYSLETA
ncbi:MAG TPA: glycoside hydrolase family 3 N-terminal domain-containing protein, partial [Legionellaceae bacterium]|nr:glycoside hydrolase family 3 N-terminal domain-containing protein [Legionellaceae bacterium]